MPRSGSTLLFDLLSTHEAVRSWEFEAYNAWKAVDPSISQSEYGEGFHPELVDADAWRRAERALHKGALGLRWRERLRLVRYRLVEKTPANVIRVRALYEMFPDAFFIYLTRDAPQNIASLLEGRERGLAARGWARARGYDWHFLMPVGWIDHVDEPPAAQFAWQWQVGNQTALDDFADLPANRWRRVRYEDLVADAQGVLADLLEFCELAPSPAVTRAATELAPSRVTLSAPDSSKWLARADEIGPVLPALASMRARLGYQPEQVPNT